jgi:hypothetical protein
MKKILCIAGLCLLNVWIAFAQNGEGPIWYDSNGLSHIDQVWAAREDAKIERESNQFRQMLQSAMDNANAHRREMERIEAEQAVERQRAQQEQWARMQELEIQWQQAEQAAMRNWSVSVYGTTLWRENESAGLKDREERFTVTAPSSAQAEDKAVQLFKSKWKNYLVDNPNIWANAVAQ